MSEAEVQAFLAQFDKAREDFKNWPQWMQDAAVERVASFPRGVGGTLPPSTDSAGWCRVCGHGNDRLGKLHLSNCPSKPAGVDASRGGEHG